MTWLVIAGAALAIVNIVVWLYDFFKIRQKDITDDNQRDRP